MLNLYRGSSDRSCSIQGGLDGIFDGSDDKYLSHGLELVEMDVIKNTCSGGVNSAEQVA